MQSQIGDPSSWPETWSVQLFRSIDSSSAAGLPANQDTLKAGLSARGSSRVVEFGIQVHVQSTCSLVQLCSKTCTQHLQPCPAVWTGTNSGRGVAADLQQSYTVVLPLPLQEPSSHAHGCSSLPHVSSYLLTDHSL